VKAALRDIGQAVLNTVDIAVAVDDLDEMRWELLAKMQRMLSLDSATFFLMENGRFARPSDLNIDPRLRKAYMDYYYQMSVFRPTN